MIKKASWRHRSYTLHRCVCCVSVQISYVLKFLWIECKHLVKLLVFCGNNFNFVQCAIQFLHLYSKLDWGSHALCWVHSVCKQRCTDCIV